MIFPADGSLYAEFIGGAQPYCPELTEVGGVAHVVIEHREKSFVAVPLERERIFALPEVYFEDGLDSGYRGVIDCGKAVEISGEVWIFTVDKDGRSIPHVRADSIVWP